MDANKFTQKSLQAVQRAQSIAMEYGNPELTALHLALALLERDGLDLPSIHTLILTHSHQDHWYPEDLAFRGEGFSHDIDGMLDIYGNDACAARLRAILPIVGQGMMDAMQARRIEAGGDFEILALMPYTDGRALLFGYGAQSGYAMYAWSPETGAADMGAKSG